MGLITRRAALAGLVGGVSAPVARAMPADLPDRPGLLVAGRQGGPTDDWAAPLSESLRHGLQLGSVLTAEHVGGPDGVTAANQFQARIAPDGATALIVPGAAPLCWLTGDLRVRFDAARWTPLWGGLVPVVVVSRGPLAGGRRLRMGVRSVVGPELAGLLALHAMGRDVEAVPLDPAARTPLGRRDLDLLVLRGSEWRAAQSSLVEQGWAPAFGLGDANAEQDVVRDPSLPDLPVARELIARQGRVPSAALMSAFAAAAAAASLEVALVLPLQTPAALVAWWRQGCAGLANAPAVQAVASRKCVRPIGAGSMAASLQSILVDASVLLDLRHWLAERYQWQPS